MQSVPEADLEHVLAHTRGIWEPLRESNIFITGGTGFFGRWLLESFAFINQRLDLGAHATVLTRNPAAFAKKAPTLAANQNIHFIEGDVRNLTRSLILPQLPKGHSGRFPFFIHAATESGTSLSFDDPLTAFDTIVRGTRAALDFAIASGTGRLLFTSSGAVYGTQPCDVPNVPETYTGGPDCTRAASAYGEGKRAAEILCACYRNKYPGFEPVIARCFAFVGPFLPLDVHFAIGNFMRDALQGGPIRVGGDGSPFRSYLHAADLAAWLWTLLFNGDPCTPYNVGSEVGVDIETLASMVAAQAQPPCKVEIAKGRTPGVPPPRYVPDVTRITSRLKVSQWISLEDSIARTLAFHRPSGPLQAHPLILP